MSKIGDQLKITLALLRRDFHVMRTQRLKDSIINNLTIITCLHTIFGIFGPYMGINKALAPAILIGIMIANFIFLGWTIATEYVFDMESDRVIDYQLTLPITLNWLLLRFVGRYVIEFFLTMFPALILSKLFVGAQVPLSQINWGLFIGFYFLSIIFVAVFFLCVTFTVSFNWFRFNVWQRLLWPMNATGCIFFTWRKAYAFKPMIGKLILLNPQVYLNEGLRATLLNRSDYLDIGICIGVTTALTIIGALIMRAGAHKKLNCVT